MERIFICSLAFPKIAQKREIRSLEKVLCGTPCQAPCVLKFSLANTICWIVVPLKNSSLLMKLLLLEFMFLVLIPFVGL